MERERHGKTRPPRICEVDGVDGEIEGRTGKQKNTVEIFTVRTEHKQKSCIYIASADWSKLTSQ